MLESEHYKKQALLLGLPQKESTPFVRASEKFSPNKEQILQSFMPLDELPEIVLEQILWLKSCDNYVELFLKESNSDSIKKHLIISTLKSFEVAFTTVPNFFRCHKSYIVNLNHISGFLGNAQGYKLKLPFAETSIPVSRKHNNFIKDYFAIRP